MLLIISPYSSYTTSTEKVKVFDFTFDHRKGKLLIEHQMGKLDSIAVPLFSNNLLQ